MITPKWQTGTDGAASLRITHGQVAATINLGQLSRDIVTFFRHFRRRLYFGHMHKDVFLYEHYLAAKQKLIRQCMDLDGLSEYDRRNLGFCMYMSRVAQRQRWRWPALLNRDPAGRIQQITGNTRAFASMLVHDRPWDSYPILFAEHEDFDIARTLRDPVAIESDQQLNEVLGVEFNDSLWEARVHLKVDIEPAAGELWCRLDYVGDGTYHDHAPSEGAALFEDLCQWRARYGLPAKLAVYTQWPENILNVDRAWDVDIVGTTAGMLIDDRPGYAERTVRSYHHSPTHDQDHVLWVMQPRMLNLTDLLLWMDTSHSTYISPDWSFLLYRRQEEYSNTFINLSRQAE